MIRLRSSSFGATGYRLRPAGFGATGCGLRRCAASARQALWCVGTAVFAMVGGRASVFACSVCFQAEESSLIDGTRLGILALLGVTLAVQGAFLGFFLYLRTRAKRIAEMELEDEWSELQRGASRAS